MSCQSKNHLLLLHGYTQDGSKVKKRVADWMGKSNLKQYQVYTPSGLYEITEEDKLKGRGWWHLEKPDIFASPHIYESKDIMKQNIKYLTLIIKEIKDKMTSDSSLSILGFSQGAVMLEILMAQGYLDIIPSSQLKIMLVSPSGIMDDRWKKPISHLPETKIPIVMGEKEGIFNITPDNYQVHTCLHNGSYKFYSHPGGHYLPGKKCKSIILDWLSSNHVDEKIDKKIDIS